jgi:hypothetical protein
MAIARPWVSLSRKQLPTPFAVDIVGEVIKLRPRVTKFQIGDTGFGFGDPQDPNQLGRQQYYSLDVDQTAKKPSNANFDEATAFSLNSMTSYFAPFSVQGLNLPFPMARKGRGCQQQWSHSGHHRRRRGDWKACLTYSLPSSRELTESLTLHQSRIRVGRDLWGYSRH